MKKVIFAMSIVGMLALVSCGDDDNDPIEPVATCNDGVQNQGETGLDCGGPNCQACEVEPTCTDGIQNGDEAGVDCGGSCPEVCDTTGGIIEVSENITSDTTWNADNIYELQGRITVTNGATLTIEAGTIIKAFAGTGANASVLIIARGANIEALGTATQPIVFTSVADNIELGQTAGTNLTENDRGLWGGLIVLGNAPVSLDGDATEAQIEGIPASDTNGLYGGNDDADDSGTIQYVSIRHGGALIGEGNEINGLTLGGVGSGTTIDNVEVVGNVDDGIEFFGGSVNASNLFVWAQGDDAIDIDQAYSGTITNVVVVQGNISDHALEIDGPEGSLDGAFTLTDVTLFGLDQNVSEGEIADYRSNAQGSTSNVLVTGFTGIGQIEVDGEMTDLVLSDVELDNDGVAANYTAGELTFSAWEIVLPEGVTSSDEIFDDRSDVGSSFETDAATFSSSVADTASATVGANTSAFSWTYSNNTANLGF
ncbi:hypothetical protein FK220_004880 [Flavobacteriaceae bacterium TP-CH-4]|uniref:Uncharacterized protein n=1 Tax=Pelagihabitans pacificus TaxID=2696054 RepID=A0A967AY13_9FLAO|nr:hypothetical protein [Pelagihabitans pacificus]NHF58661.1 hypothetical protein [Pelagihabitans pacificus]